MKNKIFFALILVFCHQAIYCAGSKELAKVNKEEQIILMQEIAARYPQIAYARHAVMGGSHYAYTEALSDAQNERTFIAGSELCLLTIKPDGTKSEEILLNDPKGIIRDVDVSFDAKRLLFSWKKDNWADDFHLYEMNLENREIRQITFGEGVADYEGIYLPNGKILFNSTRCIQTVDCWWTEVSNLYTCNLDGSDIQRITYDQVHDNYPTLTEEGRVLYTRWEYNDRGQLFPQPLFRMNPDGTNQRAIYGENSWFPTTILHARSIPNSTKMVAIGTGHHSLQTGELILIDTNKGNQEAKGIEIIAPVKMAAAVQIDQYGQQGPLYMYPFPISEDSFLVVSNPAGWKNLTGHPHGAYLNLRKKGFGLHYVDTKGRQFEIVSGNRLSLGRPVPVVARNIPNMPSNVDRTKLTGTFYVQDVYEGTTKTVKRGEVKYLRAVALDYRVAGIGNNESVGPGGSALVSTPVSVGNASWDPKIILGDAIVEDDGSVSLEAPANVPLYFMLLDKNKRMIHSMRSWTVLQPNENNSCVGCHESHYSAPPANYLAKAMHKKPEPLKPFVIPPNRGLSFVKDLQPILDKHCISCHDNFSGKEIKDPIAKRRWTQSYLELTHTVLGKGKDDHKMVNWLSSQSVPTALPPYSAGANKSELIRMLDRGHGKTALTSEELEVISAWIDLSVPFCGSYSEQNLWNEAENQKYQHFIEKRKKFQTKGEVIVTPF